MFIIYRTLFHHNDLLILHLFYVVILWVFIGIRENCVDCILNALTIHAPTVENVFVSEIDRVVQWAGTDFAADIRNLLQDEFSKKRKPLPPPSRRSHGTEDFDHKQQRVISDFSKQIDCLLHYGKFINRPSQMNEMLAFCNLRVSDHFFFCFDFCFR